MLMKKKRKVCSLGIELQTRFETLLGEKVLGLGDTPRGPGDHAAAQAPTIRTIKRSVYCIT